MPVTALPASNTERWFYDYTVLGNQHTLMMRTADAITPAQAAEAIDLFLLQIDSELTTITTVGLRVAAAGSNITNPADPTGLSATYGSGAGSAINAPLQVTFTGRSADGHKSRVGIFGWNAQTDTSWRMTPAEVAAVGAEVTNLDSLSSAGLFVSISGQGALWHPYANIGYNDHWVKEARG
jgi:hypothetical protein